VRRGAAVVATARNAAALEALRDRLTAKGGRIAICVADVSDMAAVERVAAVAVEAFGGFDTWVNNAGIGTYGTLEQVPIADHRRVFDVNYFGVLHGSLVAARHLRGRGGAGRSSRSARSSATARSSSRDPIAPPSMRCRR